MIKHVGKLHRLVAHDLLIITLWFTYFCLHCVGLNIFDTSVTHQLLCESLPIFVTYNLLPGHLLLIFPVTLTFQLKVKQ